VPVKATDLAKALRQWTSVGLSLVYPEVCQACGTEPAGVEEGFIGPLCRSQVKWIQSPFCDRCGLPFHGEITAEFECANCREMKLHFSHARSAVAAEGLVLEMIHRYKYERALWVEPFLAGLLAQAAEPELRGSTWEAIIPVPLHPSKEREREFNQAARLAARLSVAIDIPVRGRALRRVGVTRTQTRLSREERAENVRRAFRVDDGESVRDARLILVDDVLTTGATTSACAEALKRAGAAEVCVWTVARGLLN
jgi:competence protein ComFC